MQRCSSCSTATDTDDKISSPVIECPAKLGTSKGMAMKVSNRPSYMKVFVDSNPAIILKHFKDFMQNRFKTPKLAFAALVGEFSQLEKVPREEFVASLKRLNFKWDADSVFTSLDADNDGFVTVEDFKRVLKDVPVKRESKWAAVAA